MAYDDYEERETSLDRGAELYDDDLYDDLDDFGERIENPMAADALTDDELAADDSIATDDTTAPAATTATAEGASADTQFEDSFNETLSDNPHIDDQLDDDQLRTEAESDYTAPDSDKEHESLIDKAKDKIDQITGHDK